MQEIACGNFEATGGGKTASRGKKCRACGPLDAGRGTWFNSTALGGRKGGCRSLYTHSPCQRQSWTSRLGLPGFPRSRNLGTTRKCARMFGFSTSAPLRVGLGRKDSPACAFDAQAHARPQIIRPRLNSGFRCERGARNATKPSMTSQVLTQTLANRRRYHRSRLMQLPQGSCSVAAARSGAAARA